MRGSLKKIIERRKSRRMFWPISWAATQRNVAQATSAQHSDGYVTRPNRMAPSQAAAYERGLAAAMAEAGTRPLSTYSVEAYRQCAREVRKYWSRPNIFDHAKHNGN